MKKSAYITAFLYTIGFIAIVLIIMFSVITFINLFVKKDYKLQEVYHFEEKGKNNLLLYYHHYNSSKGGGYYHHHLRRLDLQTGELSKDYYSHSNKSWSNHYFTLIQKNDDFLLFDQGQQGFVNVNLYQLDQYTSEKEYHNKILKKYPQIGEIHKKSLQGYLLHIINEAGQTFWIDIHTLESISQSQAEAAQKQGSNAASYVLPKEFKTKQTNNTPKPSITIDIDDKSYNLEGEQLKEQKKKNYPLMSLEGNPQRVFASINPENGQAIPLNTAQYFLKGEFVRPSHSRYDYPTKAFTHTTIFAKNPDAVFIMHHSTMSEQKAQLLLSKVACEDGKLLFQKNIGQDKPLDGEHKLQRAMLDHSQLILFFSGDYEINILSVAIDSGKILWHTQLAY